MSASVEMSAGQAKAEATADATIEPVDLTKTGSGPGAEKGAGISRTPIWPDYFARLGQPDAANWQYQGYWSDTFNCWRAFYSLMFLHPVKSFLGLKHFFQSLIYRISDESHGRAWLPLIVVLTPILMLFAPIFSLLAVAIAPPYLQHVKKIEIPPLFQPFSFMGWANYNVMLMTMFTLHAYLQHKAGLHPSRALKHSSKIFWHEVFENHLPEGHHATKEYAVIVHGHVRGELPEDDIVIKPTHGGAGVFLRTMTWDAENQVYICEDPEKQPDEATTYTKDELKEFILKIYDNGVIEKLHRTREPFPVSSFRIMTLNADGNAELMAAVFLPAPEGSNSTAYFDLDTYLMNYEDSTIGQPIRPHSDGKYTGIPVPEMNDVIEACIAMHNKMYGDVEISWDVIFTNEGPVYLEGNIFPPGCDYKLSIFKKYENYLWLRRRLLGVPTGMPPGVPEQIP
ncbi:MAG: hypothetical protein QNJ73_01115 [Gammaproteobacteria bacterium]|nr:hypothetical protein [Gammaproteobacteria bacterium]